jgi:hypothetical protein
MNSFLLRLGVAALLIVFGIAVSDVVSASRVKQLGVDELQTVIGGDDCYVDDTLTCGDEPENGCNAACTIRGGTTVYRCYDGDQMEAGLGKGVYMEQPEYDNFDTTPPPDGVDDLTPPEEVPCNVYYCCGCNSNHNCTSDESDPDCVNEPYDGQNPHDDTAEIQQPDGDDCDTI